MSEYDGPCEAGCIPFHGGEKRHHEDCGHYPRSLTKVNADRITALTAERDALAEKLAAERERCAKVAENTATCLLPSGHFLSERVAATIRKGGK